MVAIEMSRICGLFNTEHPVRIKGNFPSDAIVIGAFLDNIRDCFMVVLEHKNFAPCFEGHVLFHLGVLEIEVVECK